MVEASTHERTPLLCTVYHGANTNPGDFGQDAENAARWRNVDELFDKKRGLTGAIVLVVDESMIARLGGLRTLPHQIIFVPTDAPSAAAVRRRVNVSLADIREPEHRARTLRAVCELACVRATTVRRRRQLARTNHELQELNRIGLALMEEHDLAVLLQRIVDVGKGLTQSDACALLLADTTVTPPQLHLGLWQIDSLPDFKPSGYTVPVDDASIVGHAAKAREPMVIADAYALPAGVGFVENEEFDQRWGYWRKSMLIVPMTDRRDRLVGLLVFINRKTSPNAIIRSKEAADRYVLPYTERELRVARSLSSQAAVSVENAQLHARIERNARELRGRRP